jgi:hypothetical protein
VSYTTKTETKQKGKKATINIFYLTAEQSELGCPNQPYDQHRLQFEAISNVNFVRFRRSSGLSYLLVLLVVLQLQRGLTF